MNTTAFLSTALAAVALLPPAMADINAGRPSAPNMTSGMRGNCDLMASNTVRARFLGLKDVPVPTLDDQAPATAQAAIFEVVENLAYRKYVRYGDGQLKQGARFTVAMDKALPGQPASVVDTISQMKPGDEAAMKVDHLFLFGEDENKSIRPCTRIARRNTEAPAPAEQDAEAPLPTRVLPLVGTEGTDSGSGVTTASSTETHISVVPDGKGGVKRERIDIRRELLPGSREVSTRMFINGVEVDPQTRQPLPAASAASAASPASPAPSPAPAPAAPGQTDDTVVEHAVPTSPAPPAAPTLSPEESF